jgi:predicted DCC family thiol-disulfide oxidoreductase YuxK
MDDPAYPANSPGLKYPVSQEEKPILFFDGVCNLCNSFVDFLLSRDSGQLFYASLQGETAKQKLDPKLRGEDLKSLVLLDQNVVYIKSDAVLRIFWRIGMPWKLLRLFTFLPRGTRDQIYDWVAAHRYQLFGKRETCRIPTPEERARFLG